jgi:L-ascorbate metabolism protein UlaG (beta-lactamase superfamily)
MNSRMVVVGVALIVLATVASGQGFQKDVIPTSAGELQVTFVGHGTLMLGFGGKIIHIDPFGKLADYSSMPKADLVLITHAHGDHLDPSALAATRTPATHVVVAPVCEGKVEGVIVLHNGEQKQVVGLSILAVPAYNIVHTRKDGTPYHPKGEGNGYVLTFGETRVYIAGDTENIPEMKALQNIAVAFLPMNLPYTMTPEMVADAARAFRPRILYPYHYGDTDPNILVGLLKDEKGIEVRVRSMK